MSTDTAKLAADLGVSEEKLAENGGLLRNLLNFANVNLDKMASDDAGKYMAHFCAFEAKMAEEGYSVAESQPQHVLDAFNAYLTKAAEDKKEEDKDKKDDEKKAEEAIAAAAFGEAQKLAELAQASTFMEQMAKIAADQAVGALVEALKEAADDEGKKSVLQRAGAYLSDKKDKAGKAMSGAGDKLKDAVKTHGGTAAKVTGVAAGAAAAAYGGKKLYDAHKAKGGEAPAEKQAFDYEAGKIAMQLLSDANWDKKEAAERLTEVLKKEAAQSGEHSEFVKSAAAKDGPAGALTGRAFELIELAGYPVGELEAREG